MNIYIDESGSINNKLSTDFIITLVVTDNQKSLKKSFKRFVSANLDKLKAVDIQEKMFLNGNFKELKGSALTPELKIDFVEHFIQKNNFELFYIHIHNSKLTDTFCSNTERVFNYVLRKALEFFIQKGFLPSEEHNIIIDERNLKTEAKYFLEEYLNLELVTNEINNGKINIKYVDSSDVKIVQIADVFSNIKFSNEILNNRNYEEEFEKLINRNFLKMTFQFPIE